MYREEAQTQAEGLLEFVLTSSRALELWSGEDHGGIPFATEIFSGVVEVGGFVSDAFLDAAHGGPAVHLLLQRLQSHVEADPLQLVGVHLVICHLCGVLQNMLNIYYLYTPCFLEIIPSCGWLVLIF